MSLVIVITPINHSLSRNNIYSKVNLMKELLIKLLAFIEQEDEIEFFGMCVSLDAMTHWKLISSDERARIQAFLDERALNKHIGFWWPNGIKEPRIKWLKNQINILNLEEDGKE